MSSSRRSPSPDRNRDRERHVGHDRERRKQDEKDRYKSRDEESRDEKLKGRDDRGRRGDKDHILRERADGDSRRSARRSRSRTRSRSPRRSSHHQSSRKDHDRDKEERKSRKYRRRSRSDSIIGSESGSGSSSEESDSEEERRRRRRKRKEKERGREDKEERRRRKEKKRDKKKRDKKSKTAAVTSQWGLYGIISEADIAKKDSEFRSWLIEERTINPETISKERSRKEFAIYVEDYNTATLPHEKYYDSAKYEIKMNMIRTGQGIPGVNDGSYDPMADLRAHSSSLKQPLKEKESFLSREEVAELRRLQNERMEIGKRKQLGLEVPKNMGVRQEEFNPMSFE